MRSFLTSYIKMPIVDGLTSTKMIRSHEKVHPLHILSSRAALNGRVPIIAVSASLVERERQDYIKAGFDGWILKPISFDRLSVIMNGIVRRETRRENLYGPGRWERGGWFQDSQKDIFSADTSPSGEPPNRAPGHAAQSKGVEVASASADPAVKEDEDSEQTQEQQRLLRGQHTGEDDVFSSTSPNLPDLGSKEYQRAPNSFGSGSSNGETIKQEKELTQSPQPSDVGPAASDAEREPEQAQEEK